MRTTVTLEPDVAAELKRIARDRDQSFKAVINETLREGLRAARAPAKPYTFPSRRMGLREGVDLTKALSMAGALDDAETLRKLELRK